MFNSLDRNRPTKPIPIPQSSNSTHKIPASLPNTGSIPLKLVLNQLDLYENSDEENKAVFARLIEYFRLHDLSQQELVGCWETVNQYLGGSLRNEAIRWVISCLKYHYNDCDLLRLDFFKILSESQREDLSDCTLLLSALTKDGRDLKNFEHDIGNLLSKWINYCVGQSQEVQIELLNLITNIVKFSFIFVRESDVEAIFKELFNAFGVNKLHQTCVTLIDAVVRYGMIPEKSVYTALQQICAGATQKESQPLASQVFINLLKTVLSATVCQNIAMILYQTDQPLEVLAGAARLSLSILQDSSQSSHHLFVLSALMNLSSLENIQICSLILQNVIKLSEGSDFSDYEILVTLFRKTRWIWKISKGKILEVYFYLKRSKLGSLMNIWDMQQILLNVIVKFFPRLSFQSRVDFIQIILELADYSDEALCTFIVSSANPHYWKNTALYLGFLEKCFRSIIVNRSSFKSTRSVFLVKVFELFQGDEGLMADISGLANRFIDLVRLDIYQQQQIFEIINRIGSSIPDSTLTYFIQNLFASISNLKSQSGVSLDRIWTPHLGTKKSIENIPDPRIEEPQKYSSLELGLDIRTDMLKLIFDLFDSLSSQGRINPAMLIYQWAARFTGWITVVESTLRKSMLQFIGSFSCSEIKHILYTSIIKSKQMHTNWSIISDYHAKILAENNSACLFAVAAIIKFETSPELLMYCLEMLKTLIQQPILGSVNPLAFKHFSQTICTVVMTESAGARLENLPGTFRKYEIYELLFQILSQLFVYKAYFNRSTLELFLSVLIFGIGKWPQAAKQCIRGLTLALVELPDTSIRLLSSILLKISQYTSNNLALVNLRYLMVLASLPGLHRNLSFEDYKRIFGIALTYLRLNDSQNSQTIVLGYYVTQIWFLSLKLSERKKYVPIIITLLLANTSSSDSKQPAESVELVLDMMVQHTYTNVNSRFTVLPPERIAFSRSWCLGNSIMTVHSTTDFNQQIILRRAAGVTAFDVKLLNDVGRDTIESKNSDLMKLPIFETAETKQPQQPRPRSSSVDVRMKEELLGYDSAILKFNEEGFIGSQNLIMKIQDERFNIDPAFLFMQVQPYPIWQENVFVPIPVGSSEAIARGITLLDRIPSIDIHKIGIMYVAEGQQDEVSILSNSYGSSHYERFLSEVGQLFSLHQNQNIYTGGLDTSENLLDGAFAICHFPDQRLAQIIFHVTTMMPNNIQDKLFTAKKRHIGNDFVNVIWNDSTSPFNFKTISGQFNIFQIVIEPLLQNDYENRFFKVTTTSNDPLSFSTNLDIVSGSSLGYFVRQIALYCNMLAQVSSGLQTSTSLERLRQIKRIKERLAPVPTENKLDFSQLLL